MVGLVNNGSNYSSGVTTIAVDNLSTSNLIAGDTFIIAGQGTGSGASLYIQYLHYHLHHL